MLDKYSLLCLTLDKYDLSKNLKKSKDAYVIAFEREFM